MPKEFSTPGPRAVYPEMCDSRSLAKCGIHANALWPRLIVQADDQGRLAGNAVDVLGLCFPKMLDRVTVRHVRTALEELEGHGMLRLYEVDGEPYIQILTWWEWQASMRRAYPSRHPAPEGWDDAVYGFEDHPPTYRAVRGLPPRRRSDDEPEPHGNGTVPAPEPHAAGTGTAAGPHRAALARAQPQARGARPDPTVPEESPPPPAERGQRIDEANPRSAGTAPRQAGTNPRANGSSPRQEREAEKRGPTRLGEVMAEVAARDRLPWEGER